jgi:hypothetical protein
VQFVRQLLSRDNRILAGVRTPDRCEGLRELKAKHSKALSIVALDVADSGSIAEWAASVAERCERVDVRLMIGLQEQPVSALVLPCSERVRASLLTRLRILRLLQSCSAAPCSLAGTCVHVCPCSARLQGRLHTHLSAVPQHSP